MQLAAAARDLLRAAVLHPSQLPGLCEVCAQDMATWGASQQQQGRSSAQQTKQRSKRSYHAKLFEVCAPAVSDAAACQYAPAALHTHLAADT